MSLQRTAISVSVIFTFIVLGLFLYKNIYSVMYSYKHVDKDYIFYNGNYYHPSLFWCNNHEMILRHPESKLVDIKTGKPLQCYIKQMTDSLYIKELKK